MTLVCVPVAGDAPFRNNGSSRCSVVTEHLDGYSTRMRSSAAAIDLEAGQALGSVCLGLGVPLRRQPGDGGIFVAEVNGRPVRLVVHGATLIDRARAVTITNRPAPSEATPLVVGDRILRDARSVLDDAGWGWLDRRGRLHLSAPGVLLDVEVDPIPRAVPKRPPTAALAASGVQEVAASLLLAPDDPVGVRELARASGFAPSTISRSLTELRVAGLVRRDSRPVSPDLFWALAEHWMPEWVDLGEAISPRDARLNGLGANLRDLATVGWAIGDTRAALAWRAPLVASADVAASIYVPDRSTLERVLDEWGRATRHSMSSAQRVAVAPVHSIASRRFRVRGEAWPVVHPLFVALDLATDRARGHQILDEWTPEEAPRVW